MISVKPVLFGEHLLCHFISHHNDISQDIARVGHDQILQFDQPFRLNKITFNSPLCDLNDDTVTVENTKIVRVFIL